MALVSTILDSNNIRELVMGNLRINEILLCQINCQLNHYFFQMITIKERLFVCHLIQIFPTVTLLLYCTSSLRFKRPFCDVISNLKTKESINYFLKTAKLFELQQYNLVTKQQQLPCCFVV